MTDPSNEAPKPLRTVDDQASTVKVVLVLAAIAAVLWFAFGRGDDESSSTSDKVSTLREITYHVTGTARSVDITIETPTGTSQQSADVPMMNKGGTRGLSFTFAPGAFVYISAQNSGEWGTVTCSIETESGLTISENTSSGAYSIATCEGTA